MVDESVRTALGREAADAPVADDLWERTERRVRRRSRARRLGGTVAAVAVLSSAAIAVQSLPLGSQGTVHMDAGGDSAPLSGAGEWEDVRVGDAVISVPEHWEVAEVDERVEPDASEADGLSGKELEGHLEGVEADCPVPEDRPVLVVRDHWGWCSDEGLLASVEIDTREAAVEAAIRRVVTAQRREGPDSLEAGHERREIAGVPVAVTDSSDRGETLLAPTLGIVIRTRPGERTDEVREVLGTLSPTSQAGRDEVLTGRLWPDGAPNGSEPKPLELWAFAPDGRVHLWHRTEAREDGWGHEGLLGWPGTTPERFAARLRIDGEVRVAAGRPGEEGKEVYAFPTDEWVPDVDSWSPSGHGIVWFDRESATPTAGIAVWEDADALADGQPPVVEQEVAVEGAEHPEHEEEGLGSLSWEEGGDLRDRNWGLVAQLERDEDGFPQLPDPLVFEPYK